MKAPPSMCKQSLKAMLKTARRGPTPKEMARLKATHGNDPTWSRIANEEQEKHAPLRLDMPYAHQTVKGCIVINLG
mgnify:CR=1 FL=1